MMMVGRWIIMVMAWMPVTMMEMMTMMKKMEKFKWVDHHVQLCNHHIHQNRQNRQDQPVSTVGPSPYWLALWDTKHLPPPRCEAWPGCSSSSLGDNDDHIHDHNHDHDDNGDQYHIYNHDHNDSDDQCADFDDVSMDNHDHILGTNNSLWSQIRMITIVDPLS